MLYCKKCKHLFEDNKKTCKCKDKFLSNMPPNADEPIFLVTVDSYDYDRIQAALDDASIPYQTKFVDKSSGTLPVISGKTNSDMNIFVPYEFLEKAEDICKGIIIDDEEKSKINIQELDTRKNKFVRFISFVLFLIMIWIVVAGTDAIMLWLKSLF